jgi:hypothetical protein
VNKNIVVSQAEELRQADPHCEEVPRTLTLHELYPDEIRFFTQRFVWSSQTKGFYTRRRYDPECDDLGRQLPKWLPFKSNGRWQHLYPQLVDSLVEKHLDFERFCRTSHYPDRLVPRDWETAFWLAMMAGAKTYSHCIDLDSHDTIGWTPVPTRWHEGKTGWVAGPYSYRYLPVVRPSLRFFQIAKVIYDHLPNRMWSFSSANCGLAVWEIYSSPKFNHIVFPAVEQRLQAVGLNGVEHYPRPPRSPGSLGKCHRRPCGMDSGVLTCNGVIADPIEQIRAFMQPPATPPFETILAIYWERLEAMYGLFLSQGESLQHTHLTKDEKQSLVDSCQQVIASVKEWSRGGYVLDLDLINNEVSHSNEEPDEQDVTDSLAQPLDQLELLPEIVLSEMAEYPECFYRADLKAVAGSSQWVQYVKFLIENGISAEDKLCEIISTLAFWFGYVELFGEDHQQIKDLLRTYVATRHNCKVTRLIAGKQEEVFAQVDRIVDSVLDSEDIEGKELFAELRQKRASGQYKQVYNFASQILEDSNSLSFLNPHNLPLYLICEDLIQEESDSLGPSEWNYQPDQTPLPDDVISRIQASFKQAKRQLRRDKANRYPTLDAIAELFNYLYAGRTIGSRRASQQLLVQMGFVNNSSKRTPLFRLLEKEGLLYKGGYLSTTKSRLWTLDKSVIEAMGRQRNGPPITIDQCSSVVYEKSD